MNKRKSVFHDQCQKKSSRPSFFKVLIRYTTKLRLPPVFVRNFGEFLPETAKLRAISGETWDVKLKEEISEDDDDKRYLWFVGRGWTKFVKDLGLKFGEFLVFFLNVDSSTFDVSVYGTHCCERRISAMDAVDSDADSEDLEVKNDSDNFPDTNCKKRLRRNCIPESEDGAVIEVPHFEFRLTKSKNYRWCVPKKFIEDANLTGKRAVVMEYPPKKRYWPVILDMRVRSSTTVEVCTGWNEFRQENGLEEGKIYSFEFDHVKNVIEVKEGKENNEIPEDEPRNGELDSNAEIMWRFSVELKHHHFKFNRMALANIASNCDGTKMEHLYDLIMPKAFAVCNGITKNREIKLQDGKGREWPVNVTMWSRGAYAMVGGFKSFLVGNEAVIGSIVSFEFIGGSAMLVRALVKNNGFSEDEESISFHF